MMDQNDIPRSGELQGKTSKTDNSFDNTIITNNIKKCRTPVKSKKEIYKGFARPAKRLIATESAKVLIESKLANCPARDATDTAQFLYHLIASSNREIHVEVHSLFIKQYFRGADIEWLVSETLIDRDIHYKKDKYCRTYTVNEDLMTEFHQVMCVDTMNDNYSRYDLIKGKYVNVELKSILIDENDNLLPELIQDRIRSYGVCKFNKHNAFRIVEKKRLEAKEILAEHGKESAKYITARAQYKCDLQAFTHIMVDCGAVDIGKGLSAYKAPYKAQKSGRITHMMGGFQSASREFTAAAFYGIDDYHNYDLVSAQTRIMRQLMDGFGFKSEFLTEYTADPKAKHKFAALIGVEAQQVKDMIHSALMGTELMEPCDKTRNRFISMAKYRPYWSYMRLIGKPLRDEKGDLKPAPVLPAHLEILLDYFDDNGEQAFAAFEKFHNCCRVLFSELKIFHTWVKDVLNGNIKNQSWFVKVAGRSFVKNKAGMSLPLQKKDTEGRLVIIGNTVPKAIAHLLQGAEACWISHLLRLAPKYGFKPVQDFHDGFISEGEVPLEAQEEASKLSGLEGILETKPFENQFPDIEETAVRLWSYPVEVVFEEDEELNRLAEELGVDVLGCYPIHLMYHPDKSLLDIRSLN